jgi:hypothetical protein
MPEDNQENLRTEYSALSQYHNSLVTFRLTLLGLFLAALGFIIGDTWPIPLHICVLGLFFTFCLYIFELRTRVLFESIARRGVEIEQNEWNFQSKTPKRSFYSLQYPDKEIRNYGTNLKILGKIPIEKFPILNKVRISHSVALDYLYIGLMIFFLVALTLSIFPSLQPSQRGGNIMKPTIEFFTSADLWANIVGGVAAAIFLGIIAWVWRQWRERRVRQLGDLMGRMIEHRNAGRHPVPDPEAWVKKAKELEQEAVKKAGKVSTASEILINWLGEFPNLDVDAEVKNPHQKQYVSLLTAVISRIRDTLGRHDR